MSEQAIITEIDAEGTGWLTLDRPEVHNAFDDTLIARMAEALAALGGDPNVRAVVLAARGKSFSAGADLNWMRRMGGYSHAENIADAMGLAELLRTLDELPKPTIARVQGPAYGGGVGLVAACDIAIAAEDNARFALTEVKLGLIPAVISPHVLAAIGPRQARRYFVSGEVFDAAEAHRIGLVHRTVPAADLDAAVRDMLKTLAGNGRRAMAEVKELIRAVTGRPIDEAVMRDTAERIARARASDEGRERITQFLEKRKAGR
jgi:methylglutaconyl-CoA hydratase